MLCQYRISAIATLSSALFAKPQSLIIGADVSSGEGSLCSDPTFRDSIGSIFAFLSTQNSLSTDKFYDRVPVILYGDR